MKQRSRAAKDELTADRNSSAGVLRPNTDPLELRSGVNGYGEDRPSERPARVVLIIVILALAFIVIITFFVFQMPLKNP